MTRTDLLVLAPLFGSCILLSYLWGLTRSDVSSVWLWGPLTQDLRPYWLVSAFLTATSYLFLWWLWTFDLQLSRTDEMLVFLFEFVFLSSALMWMFITVWYMRVRCSRVYVSVNVWTTAIASGALLYMANHLPLDEPWWKRDLAVASGVMLVVQHVFWDAVVWNQGFL
jgi:hypothetical protein